MLTVGRKLDPADLRPLPRNAHVVRWWPQAAVLAHAAAMLGHGGFGTTMGALAAGVPQVVVPSSAPTRSSTAGTWRRWGPGSP